MKTTLTQEEKRIHIAKACGYSPHIEGRWIEPDGKMSVSVLPDYFADLNECAKMERTMTNDQRYAYDKKLQIVLLEGAKCQEDYWLISAKAEFRSEAFGLTLGLW